ncbi:MAG: NADH:ubiquinone oxidoreductase, partial [Vezdaea acicularis]
RVHSARSKLPAPVNTPPHASPRSGSALGHSQLSTHSQIPSNITVRSGKRRTGGSNASTTSSLRGGGGGIVGRDDPETTPLSTTYVSRLSFGAPGPDRPSSSRPSSRASTASRSSLSHSGFPQRPSSRAGARTPLSHYGTSSISMSESRRPRSSVGGNYAAAHSHSISVNGIEEQDMGTPTPAAGQRRNTLNKSLVASGAGSVVEGGSAIPTPSGLPRRQSGGHAVASGLPVTPAAARRTSAGFGNRDGEEMAPPPSSGVQPLSLTGRSRKLSGVGETY